MLRTRTGGFGCYLCDAGYKAFFETEESWYCVNSPFSVDS